MDELTSLDDVERRLEKKHRVVTGRATTALYVLLEGQAARDRSVVLPVNLCYSLVNAITMSGNRPLFVDVDPADGNTTLAEIEAALSEDTHAVLLPHQYGNPCADTLAIAGLCTERGIQLIEDCAAGFDGSIDGVAIGSIGEHALLSFGSKKTVDASIGGALLSRHPLESARRVNDSLPYHSERIARLTALYSALYRTVYHSGHYDELDRSLAAFNAPFEEIYRYRLRPEEIERVGEVLADYPANRARRLRAQRAYDDELVFDDRLRRYPIADGAVPWRYNLLFSSHELRAGVVRALLDAKSLVSVWYPPVHRLFGDDGAYPQAAAFADRILNLPVGVEADEVGRICATVRRETETDVDR